MIKGTPTVSSKTYAGETRMDGMGFLSCPACGNQLDVSTDPGTVHLICNKPGGCNDVLEYTFSSHAALQLHCQDAISQLIHKHDLNPEGEINVTHEYGGPPPFSFETNK